MVVCWVEEDDLNPLGAAAASFCDSAILGSEHRCLNNSIRAARGPPVQNPRTQNLPTLEFPLIDHETVGVALVAVRPFRQRTQCIDVVHRDFIPVNYSDEMLLF